MGSVDVYGHVWAPKARAMPDQMVDLLRTATGATDGEARTALGLAPPASLWTDPVADPDDAGDTGVRWRHSFTAFVDTNDTRSQLIANNELPGGDTPDTFQQTNGVDRTIDWMVLHEGNELAILNLDASMNDASEQSYRLAIRSDGVIWDFAIADDANDADPYEVPTTAAILAAIVAAVGDGLDVIIYDRTIARRCPDGTLRTSRMIDGSTSWQR